MTDEQLQLWPTGPDRFNYLRPKQRQCAEPGCEKSRRTGRGNFRYCEEHARGSYTKQPPRRCRHPNCNEWVTAIGNTWYCDEHFRGSSNHVPRKMCRAPGCENPRRSIQGARYCEEHARKKDGVDLTQQARIYEPSKCVACAREFNKPRANTKRPPTLVAWYSFCPDCRHDSPFKKGGRLAAHNVPPELVVQWLRQGRKLSCDLCGRRLQRHRGGIQALPHIDHDHTCCPGSRSCGNCVRGILCEGCNLQIGQVEALTQKVPLNALFSYLSRTHIPLAGESGEILSLPR